MPSFASKENFLKKTLIIMSLILLLAPVTILTTIFLSTTSNYLRVQADPCTNGVGGEFIANPPSTIPEGTPSITVSGTDPCDPSHTRLEFRIWDGGCGSIGYGATIVTQAYALTDDSSAFAVNIQTSTLSGEPRFILPYRPGYLWFGSWSI